MKSLSKCNIATYICLFLLLPLGVFSLRTLLSDPCDPSNELDPQALRADQITVLINGYSESRIALLQTIAATYSASPLVSSVLVLWGNPSTPPQTLAHLAHNLSLSSFGMATITLVRQPSSSLNDRFLPRSSIRTQAVLICDDDVEVDRKSFDFAFQIWRLNPNRLVGLFIRSHDLDLLSRKWIYTVHPDKYSIVLTKFMILKSQYLFEYSCKGGPNMSEMRRIVDQMKNCEDILMNFVVADRTNAGPILVGADKVRDWGDARNEDNKQGLGLKDAGGSKVTAAGLSSRKREHRKRRGQCITEFHKLLGRMPLRYNYGKIVNSVGEQGLCMKGGKLVFCDRYQ
ncbi:glycosyltransferase family protein 64 C3 [Jatropha curcas]|uniref:glycosyltransferase family protein 64 C3 n=1 Tax=Jatropha curcas TaxID=180498 RepID=UPI001895BFF9|nr:glycosyltransferase family protein 64 C3 [Jatropha curcas]